MDIKVGQNFYGENLTDFINPKENRYYICCIICSIIISILAVVSIAGILYLIIIPSVLYLLHGIFIAEIKGNGIRISERQLPEVYRLAQKYSARMGMPVPEIYVIQSGGMLNAFATSFASRKFVVLYSDILDMAYSEGEHVVSFILCHELAHIRRQHVQRSFTRISMVIPIVWNAYSRACEYTCDAIANYMVPEGAVEGLLILAAGKKLYKRVSLEELENQRLRERGFFMWLGKINSTHPYLSHRIAKVRNSQGGFVDSEAKAI